jgi:hypothetical protein
METQAVEIIGNWDVELITQYLDTAIGILLCMLFVICLMCGIMVGHYVMERFRN